MSEFLTLVIGGQRVQMGQHQWNVRKGSHYSMKLEMKAKSGELVREHFSRRHLVQYHNFKEHALLGSHFIYKLLSKYRYI